MLEFLSQIDRFLHVLFGITWIGLLYYFNFVGAGYLKEATPEGKKDVLQKLQPNALWYFRWAALFTFLTGVYLLWYIGTGYSVGMSLGALMATIMFLNVWLIIWPNQKKVIAGTDDAAEAGAKAALASRTNTLFSFPMLYFMIYSAHISVGKNYFYEIPGVSISGWETPSLWIGTALILAIEANAIFGKMRNWLESVKAVIHSGLVLTLVFGLLVYYY
tara:strand:+ start:163 stop:816 length:654 start_codon:yes stop_codon:yes gene_type:complete